MAIYLQYDEIKGNVTALGYEGYVAVDFVKFSSNRGISMEAGNLANREVSQPVITEIMLRKVIDSSAITFFKKALSGSSGKKATIKFVRTNTDNVQEYVEYSLENCLVSGYMINARGDDEPIETITLSFSKIIISYTDHGPDNKVGSLQRAGYDLTTAKPL